MMDIWEINKKICEECNEEVLELKNEIENG